MDQRLIEKLVRLAEKNPKGVFRSTFFGKYCDLMEIKIAERGEHIFYSYEGKEAVAGLITHENCQRYKCIIAPNIKGVRIWEFLKVLVYLRTSHTIEAPREPLTAGKEAYYYIDSAKKHLLPA